MPLTGFAADRLIAVVAVEVDDAGPRQQQQADHQGHTRQSMRAEQEELARLRRENATLKQERDFLKRAAAFFAKESR